MISVLRKFEIARPFTDDEAWLLFRIAAIGEACGWTLLLLGILCKKFITPGNNIPVQITGQLHGTIFIIYIVAALGLYPSLGWSRKRAIIAGLMSVPPYGSLLFEQWAARQRYTSEIRSYSRILVYVILLQET
jgi:integral membrane protein